MRQVFLRGYVTLFLALSGNPLSASLGHLTFDEFLDQAPCAIVAQVENVEMHAEAIRKLDSEDDLDISCKVRVMESFSREGFAEKCRHLLAPAGAELVVWFSSEIHSSQPQKGETAVVFPKKRDGVLQEAVYGRSYWRLVKWPANLNLDTMEWDVTWSIEVTWRNNFLIWPVTVTSGERALLPLTAAKREWEGPRIERRPR
jgi:hypothetical protein